MKPQTDIYQLRIGIQILQLGIRKDINKAWIEREGFLKELLSTKKITYAQFEDVVNNTFIELYRID